MAKKSKGKIDARKKLLARMAGNIAAGILSAPEEAPGSADSIAQIAVDIAEEILNKIGVEAEPSQPASGITSS